MSYFTSSYMTCFLHATPFNESGPILDLLMVFDTDIIESLLLAMLNKFRSNIIGQKGRDKIGYFLRAEMVSLSLKNNGIRDFLSIDLIDKFLEQDLLGFDEIGVLL